MWDIPGIEPKSPGLAGEFFTTEPPGKLSSKGFFPIMEDCVVNTCYSPSELSPLTVSCWQREDLF